MRNIDRASLKKIIRDYNNNCWHKGLNDKSALRFYATEKKTIKYDAAIEIAITLSFMPGQEQIHYN